MALNTPLFKTVVRTSSMALNTPLFKTVVGTSSMDLNTPFLTNDPMVYKCSDMQLYIRIYILCLHSDVVQRVV